MIMDWGPLEVSFHEYWVVWIFLVEKFGEPVEYGLVFELSLRCGWLW